MADYPQARRGLSEEELHLLGQSELAEEGSGVDHDQLSYPAPAGYRDRLVLGDLSW